MTRARAYGRRLAPFWIPLLFLIPTPGSPAQETAADHRASIVYNLSKFVVWPPEADGKAERMGRSPNLRIIAPFKMRDSFLSFLAEGRIPGGRGFVNASRRFQDGCRKVGHLRNHRPFMSPPSR